MKILLKHYLLFILLFTLIMLFSFVASSDQRKITHLSERNHFDSSNKMVAQNILPNLRFGSINIHSRKGTYDIIAFKEYDYSVTLFVDNSGAKNVRVRAGIDDGKVFYDKTLSYVSEAAPKRITFSYTMPVGAHTMYIEVDPENTIKEFNETDNRTTRTFIANLRINVH